jgi:beta-galactosidase
MKKILSLFVLLILLYSNFFAQIRIKEITSDLPTNSLRYSSTISRKIISLNENWTFYQKESEKKGININVPSMYSSDEIMVFQKKLDLSTYDILNNNFRIHFLGISYSADIFLNDIIIYKKAGGNIPFTVELSNDLITPDGENFVKVIVKKRLDSQYSIPLFQRFLFPKNSGGIVRDVFLEMIPKENIQLVDYSSIISENLKSAQIDFILNSNSENLELDNEYKIEVSVSDPSGKIIATKEQTFDTQIKQTLISLSISNPRLWFPNNPHQYTAEIKLLKNNLLVDLSRKKITITSFENRPDGIFLNDKMFKISGVTYIPSDKEYGELISYSELKKDLQIIKEIGVNSVRFAKATPHPFAFEICSDLGLIPFIEIPLNSPPEIIADDINFSKRAERFVDEYVKSYSSFSSIFAVGLGGGYFPNSSIHFELIKKLGKVTHSSKNVLTYASFSGIPLSKIEDLDLYGIELFNQSNSIENISSDSQIGINNIFISEATYPTYNGNTNGYLNKYSLEAQAKFFEQTIDIASSKNLSGFFINSMFDYYGDFNSFYTKYSEDNFYQIGILGADRNINRTSYKVIKAKINNSKRVTIPLGSTKDNAPMFFIVVGLVLAIFMGILINSKKKLREDATRAFLRPYNFFADIRDHRIISGLATILLMFILAGSHALLIGNLLYYFRDSIILENVIIAFGIPSLVSTFSYLAWNPTDAFIIFFVISILFFLSISMLIFFTSFFIRIKIYFRDIFFTVVWAVLPLALLLPVKMVLYRILATESFNLYIYIFLGLYFLWLARRIIKGIYVIFDINASKAYLYSFIACIVILGSLFVYFQAYHSTIYYLINVFNQAKLI